VLPRLFAYMRYNAELSAEGLEHLGLGQPRVKPENVQRMDSIEYMGDLTRVGAAVAKDIARAHFAGFLG